MIVLAVLDTKEFFDSNSKISMLQRFVAPDCIFGWILSILLHTFIILFKFQKHKNAIPEEVSTQVYQKRMDKL